LHGTHFFRHNFLSSSSSEKQGSKECPEK